MSALQMSHIDLEQGGGGGGGHRHGESDGGSVCFSDADDGSCYSMFYSTVGGSYDDDYRFDWVSESENGGVSVCDSRRVSSVSVSSVEVEVPDCGGCGGGGDGGVSEIKVHLDRVERDCRICHLSLDSTNNESGVPMELGCSCKDDLAAAHKHCAEAWFKIKGNKTCEICNSVARNVVGVTETERPQQSIETNNATNTAAVAVAASQADNRSFWHGHRFLNFLLACMVFAFVISWLFHFNVPS